MSIVPQGGDVNHVTAVLRMQGGGPNGARHARGKFAAS
jgi:hypothetical protein